MAFTLVRGQSLPSTLIGTPNFQVTSAVHSGYLCLSVGGKPAEWPSGYKAVQSGNQTVDVVDGHGKIVLKIGQGVQFQEAELSAGANPCARMGSTIMAILSVNSHGYVLLDVLLLITAHPAGS